MQHVLPLRAGRETRRARRERRRRCSPECRPGRAAATACAKKAATLFSSATSHWPAHARPPVARTVSSKSRAALLSFAKGHADGGAALRQHLRDAAADAARAAGDDGDASVSRNGYCGGLMSSLDAPSHRDPQHCAEQRAAAREAVDERDRPAGVDGCRGEPQFARGAVWRRSDRRSAAHARCGRTARPPHTPRCRTRRTRRARPSPT